MNLTYDMAGRMLTRTSGGITTTFLWDSEDRIRDLTPEGQQPGSPRDGQKCSVASDALGCVPLMTDSSGDVVFRRDYGALGETLPGGFDNVPGGMPYSFVGALGVRTDADTGLAYMRQRWYDPTAQRFISRDPIGLRGGANGYAYAANSPGRFVDPTGLKYCLKGERQAIQRFLNLLRRLTCLNLRLDSQNCIVVTGSHCDCKNATLENELILSQTITDIPLNVVGLLENYPPSPGLYRNRDFSKLSNHLMQMDVWDALESALGEDIVQGIMVHELVEARDAVLNGRWGMGQSDYGQSHANATEHQHRAWREKGAYGITDTSWVKDGQIHEFTVIPVGTTRVKVITKSYR